jgi:hypothetical protein
VRNVLVGGHCPGRVVLGGLSWEGCPGRVVLGGLSWEGCPGRVVLGGLSSDVRVHVRYKVKQ